MDKLAQSKINLIRRQFIKGPFNAAELGRQIGVQSDTVYNYIKKFKEIQRLNPHKLRDFTYLPSKPKPIRKIKYPHLVEIFPELADNATTLHLSALQLWKDYRDRYPNGYCLVRFTIYFNKWRKTNNICKFYNRRIRVITPCDLIELTRWRNSSDFELWKKALVILDSFACRPIAEIGAQIEVSRETILHWMKLYKEEGIERLKCRLPSIDQKKIISNKIKQDNILKLLQQSPKLHDINRTSWKLVDLSTVYEKVYHQALGPHSIGRHLRKMGYHFKKSRERLSSPDKNFVGKMDKIKSILSNLKPNDKFFSIDEYGPAIVVMKTGWSLTKDGDIKTVSNQQKIKGWYIVTAALELSTNQVTHFYSPRKDSYEMIHLFNILSEQYKTSNRLFISWDAASWHRSTIVKAHILKVNNKGFRREHGTPALQLAPLPSCAQYFNVIESVFSGMAKSVVHNSDYESLDECKVAIDRYFKERNEYFRLNPKAAGNKIWGKEIVKPVFSETQNCKHRLKSIYKPIE